MRNTKVDWWRPAPGSKLYERLDFLGVAVAIVTGTFALATVTWTLVSSNDGRLKVLVWWAIGITVLGAMAMYRLFRRENRETRYARALENLHMAHHILRDAAYDRYIAKSPEKVWRASVDDALGKFARSFSIASGASCHATVKIVVDRSAGSGASRKSPDVLEVETYARSVARVVHMRPEIKKNTVGHNTDFRYLFNAEANNRCWYHNDLLTLEGYENPHWPANPTNRNVPYRSTMVWPIRKVILEGGSSTPIDFYILGFLTIDSSEPNILEYERHFHLGAGFADHLLSVLWDLPELRAVHQAIMSSSNREV